MIYFLYGSDTFRSRKKLNEIISKYKETHKSGLNFFRLDTSEIDFEDFRNKIDTVSIFAEKRLVVLENVFSNKKFWEEFLEWTKKNNLEQDKDRIVVVYEGSLERGKDQSFPGGLKQISKSQEFKLLGETPLKKWILAWLKEKSFFIKPEALQRLVLFVGPDLWQMENELKKLLAYRKSFVVKNESPRILAGDVDLLVKPRIETTIFEAVDALNSKNKKTALRLFHKMLDKGESELYIFSMITYTVRNLIQIKSAQEKVSYQELPKVLKLHPYVIKKSYQPARSFTFEELKKIYEKLLDIDIDIKRGRVEPKVALDLLILGI